VRKQEVRDRILGAAFELFLDRGVSTTTIEDIRERTDVARRLTPKLTFAVIVKLRGVGRVRFWRGC
jgi:Bacterial regulatory proteins, tetR family